MNDGINEYEPKKELINDSASLIEDCAYRVERCFNNLYLISEALELKNDNMYAHALLCVADNLNVVFDLLYNNIFIDKKK